MARQAHHSQGEAPDAALFRKRFPLAHTFSIVACDPQSGALGVAVQSHWFSVGSVVTWAEAGVGAVATQATAEIRYGPLGLDLLRQGLTPQEALDALLASDSEHDVRQVAMVNGRGEVACHTGGRCIPYAGHILGEGFSTEANMMANDRVWGAMAAAFRQSTGPLAERLLAALDAGQAAGGDVRGQQSAALLVVPADRDGPGYRRLVDLRVEDSPQPIAELRRLYTIQQAYELMNQGDDFLAKGDFGEANRCYQQGAHLYPDNPELPFWQAVTLLNIGRTDEALLLLKTVFAQAPNWRQLLESLPGVGLLKVEDPVLRQIRQL